MEQTAVIIPVLNGERFLARALDSVLAQSRRPCRIVVVDDASSDGSVALARGYASRGHAVEVLTSDVNGGPGSARNRGLAQVRVEFVYFLDADDWWLPQHCETVLNALEAHASAGFAHSLGVLGSPPDPSTDTVRIHHADSLWRLLFESRIPQSAVVARRAAVLAVGGYDAEGRYAEDYDLWLRMVTVAPYVEVRAGTYERGLHDAQASRRNIQMLRGAWKARQKIPNFVVARGMALDGERWKEVLELAFERDLAWAWRSRSRAMLGATLDLHHFVPGGTALRRKWGWRMQLVWPGWRLAACGWDALPDEVRRLIRQAGRVWEGR